MDILHAKIAYANTLLNEAKARQTLFHRMITCFNEQVKNASHEGKFVCAILWKDFDINEFYATDCEATSELLNSILGAGYEVEFCYNGATVANPCGIVVAWGPEAGEHIADFFNYSDRLFRGE